MKFFLISVLLFLFYINNLYSQVHSDWVQRDTSLFNTLDSIIDDPKQVENYFLSHAKRITKDSLGFGWLKVNAAKAGGYISIWAEFLYFHDSLKTYTLKSYLPDEIKLEDDYKSVYAKLLPENYDDWFYYHYKEENILAPIEAFVNTKITTVIPLHILKYMSPNSGIEYGNRGGIAMSLLENRNRFNGIKDSLTEEQIITIMYSINPASRLTAIEYYLRNKKKFHKSKNVDDWIEKVYSELPKVKTMSGCQLIKENSKYLVTYFSKSNQK